MEEKLDPKEFWAFIDETIDRLESWVRKNAADKNYEVCGQASNVLYRILVDWKINERCGEESVDDVIHIACLSVRDRIRHDVVMIHNFFHDPTHMQFNPPLTTEEYNDGYLYGDYYDDCLKLFEDETLSEICREIRPELYG